MRRRKRKTGYRGRLAAQRATRRLTLALTGVLVLVVVILGVGQRWVVYTDQGVHFAPPFLSQTAPIPPKVDVSIQVQAEAPTPGPTAQTLLRTRAVWLTVDVLEEDGLQAVESAGADTVVLDMKTPDGRLGYVSYQSLAAAGNGDSDRVISLLAQLRSEGVRAVACVSCFRDDGLAGSDGWLSPGDEPVEQYLAGVAAELARMGFDEILLEYWQAPGAQAEQTAAFLTRMEHSLEDTGAVLSVLSETPVPNTLSGRLWSQIGEGSEVVRLTTAFDPEGLRHQAIRSM